MPAMSWIPLVDTMAMLVAAVLAMYAMTRHRMPQSLVMPLLACAFLAFNASSGATILQDAAARAAPVLALFTAVAVPAHLIQRSNGFSWMAAALGGRLGLIFLRRPRLAVPTLVVGVLFSTFAIAATMHNITGILVMVPIAIGLCTRYDVPSGWLLCGMLVASNLGGFSSAWGDTPNIVEAATWNLSARAFASEILPVNLGLMALLSTCVLILVRHTSHHRGGDAVRVAGIVASYRLERREIRVDQRLFFLGTSLLATTITLTMLWPAAAVSIAAAAVLLAVVCDRHDDQQATLAALGFDVYMTLFSVFVIATAVEHSQLGNALQTLIRHAHGAPWAIALAAFVGTATTEAASWASATSAITHGIAPSHAAAWALGGGICAGSSALLTAASAGIILAGESSRFGPEHEVTFDRYLRFGVPASVAMLLIYATVWTASAFV